ncbi:MAG: VWA domain-containing protein [Chloroflexaceae bacterium]|nr:VWA domain-containing protein [Chloroflexaceae bacterium]
MVTFVAPRYLWLLLLLLPVWALALVVPRSLPGWRFWGSLLLRSLGVAGLVLAMAGTQFRQPVDDLGVVFLLDVSESIALSQRARAETYVQQALSQLSPNDRAGIVVFGDAAIVERLPNDSRLLGTMTTLPNGTRTNIQQAIQLGLALLPTEMQRRLVLLSDGRENYGDAREAARLAAAQGVPIDVVVLSGSADGLDAQVSGLELPSVVGEGQQPRLVVHLDSRGPPGASGSSAPFSTAARLVVEQRISPASPGLAPVAGRQELASQEVTLTGQPQTFEVLLPPPTEVFNRYVVRLEVEGDARPENNAAEAFTFVQGKPRVLLVEGTPGAAEALQRALAAADLVTERVAPDRLPGGLSSLIAYDAVILVDVPKRALSERARIDLRTYVRDLGRGFAMVGGSQSFGAGGWRDTPVEEALPVFMDLRTVVQRQPPVSIVVIIDVSGSMGAMEPEGGHTKIELAAEGAARIAERLRDEDEITIIPFDTAPHDIVGPVPGTRRDEAIDRAATIRAGGGGINIHDALHKASLIIRERQHPIRHIITITDGSDTVQQEGAHALVDDLRTEGVTVSAIAVGTGSDVPFIEEMAQRGGGRFFLTEHASEIPTILTSEAQAVIQPLIIEGEWEVLRGPPHPILRGVDGIPPLYGYVATTPKASGQVLLSTERGHPLLAAWSYGLGRSVAWTSDMQGKWAKEWMGWPGYQRMATQMVSWLLPSSDPQRMTLETRADEGSLALRAYVRTESGAPATGLRVTGQMLASGGRNLDITLREVSPGTYYLAVTDAPAGVYLVHLLAADAQGQPQAGVTGGAMVPFSAEYRNSSGNPALLASLAEMTGGRNTPPPDAVADETDQQAGLVRSFHLPLLWLALLALPLDVAIRRIFGRNRGLMQRPRPVPQRQQAAKEGPVPAHSRRQRRGSGLPLPTAPPPDDPLERLRAAQERARRRARGGGRLSKGPVSGVKSRGRNRIER